MKKSYCDTCNENGWIETAVYSSTFVLDGTIVIEKCDSCNVFANDSMAAKYVNEKHNVVTIRNNAGFNIKMKISLN